MKYEFKSGLSPYIEGLIKQKRADGFAYNSAEIHLKRFDNFCVEFFPTETTVTYELAAAWSDARPAESDAYHNNRIGAVKRLSEYILSLGVEAYVPNFFHKVSRPVLYIPSKEEVRELIAAMDKRTSNNTQQRHMDRGCKVLFLLYFCCGLRLSEGLFLKWEAIDLNRGIITIMGSKGNVDRLVYLPADSIPVLEEYKNTQQALFPGCVWAFPGQNPEKPISDSAVESSFRRHWNMLPIAKTLSKHPTPHCLRHAFVVERFNDWMRQGIDTNMMLPYLSRYLGHKSPDQTYYYYHLVSNAFDTIRQNDTVSDNVIPEVITYEE